MPKLISLIIFLITQSGSLSQPPTALSLNIEEILTDFLSNKWLWRLKLETTIFLTNFPSNATSCLPPVFSIPNFYLNPDGTMEYEGPSWSSPSTTIPVCGAYVEAPEDPVVFTFEKVPSSSLNVKKNGFLVGGKSSMPEFDFYLYIVSYNQFKIFMDQRRAGGVGNCHIVVQIDNVVI